MTPIIFSSIIVALVLAGTVGLAIGLHRKNSNAGTTPVDPAAGSDTGATKGQPSGPVKKT